jgi:GNAT superfamily N-acetyltransferase
VTVGMANVGPARDDDLDADRVGEIRAMYADPSAWSTGVGSALMRASMDHLRGCGQVDVTLWVLEDNLRARAFYERWGFRPDGARQVVELGRAVPEIRYYRQLDDARSPGPDR